MSTHTLVESGSTGVYLETPDDRSIGGNYGVCAWIQANAKALLTVINAGPYVPYNGANANVDLGSHALSLDSNTIQIGSAATGNGPGSAQFGLEWQVEIEPANYPDAMVIIAGNILLNGDGSATFCNSLLAFDSTGFITALAGVFVPLVCWSDDSTPYSQLIIDGGSLAGNWIDTSTSGAAADQFGRFYLYWSGSQWEIEDTFYTDGIIGVNGSSLVALGGTNQNDPTDGNYTDGGNDYLGNALSLLPDRTTFGKLDTQGWSVQDPFAGGNPSVPDPVYFTYDYSSGGSGINTWTIDPQGNFSGTAARANQASTAGTSFAMANFGYTLEVNGSSIRYTDPSNVLLWSIDSSGNFSGVANGVQTHASAPSSPFAGQTYLNTTDHHFYGWNGSAWKQLDN